MTATTVLLVQTTGTNPVAVRFPNREAAEAWESEHDEQITGLGLIRIVSKAEALRESE